MSQNLLYSFISSRIVLTLSNQTKNTPKPKFFFLHDVEILEIIPLFSLNIFMFEKKTPVLYTYIEILTMQE